MWNDRFDDLWLYPMPEWFVRFCNRFVGAHALELLLISEILGLVAIVAGFAGDWFWLQIVGYVLLAPGPLLIAMMVVTAQLQMWQHRRKTRAESKSREDR